MWWHCVYFVTSIEAALSKQYRIYSQACDGIVCTLLHLLRQYGLNNTVSTVKHVIALCVLVTSTEAVWSKQYSIYSQVCDGIVCTCYICWGSIRSKQYSISTVKHVMALYLLVTSTEAVCSKQYSIYSQACDDIVGTCYICWGSKV